MPFSHIQRATGLITAFRPEVDNMLPVSGTAFLIADSILLTAYHVIRDAERITVQLTLEKPGFRTEFEARCIGYDKPSDTALLEIDGSGCAMPVPLPLSTQKFSVGDVWQTYGFPRSRTRTGQTIHGELLQYDGLPNQTWTLSAHGLSPNTSIGGLSGAACVHEGFVVGIVQRQEGSNVAVVSLANCRELLLKSGAAVHDSSLVAHSLAIKDVIRVHDLPPFLNHNYTERDDIHDLLEEINSSTCLLLSGDSFCGKSAVAQRVMMNFWSEGYRYYVTGDPYEARRFLNERASSICLLEDPYGHSILNEKTENWRLVHDVCKDVKGNNKLIITSKTSSLLHAADALDLNGCRILGNSWRNLTVSNRAFLLNIWDSITGNNPDFNPVVSSVVKYHLEYDNLPLLQPGHLVHLSAENSELTQDMTFAQLRHVAMADAHELSKAIKERGINFWQTAASLALASSTNKSVRYEDLFYILNTENSVEISFEEEKLFHSYGFGSSQEDIPAVLPAYSLVGTLSEDVLNALHFFESRGYILNQGNQFRFTHPQYYEAALYTLSGLKTFAQKQLVLQYVEQTLSCQNNTVTYQCAGILKYLYSVIKESELKQRLIEIALKASTLSIFPKTKAKCLVFLLSVFQELTVEVKKKIEYLVSADKIRTSNIFWSEGVPFLLEKHRFPWQVSVLNDEDLLVLKTRADTEDEVGDEIIWRLVSSGKFLTPKIIRNALNSNEGFIRARAAISFFQQYHEFASPDKEEIAKLIFTDEYPSVIVEAIKSIVGFCIKLCSQDELLILVQLTKGSLSNPFVVLRLKTFIMSFGIDYGPESIDWRRMSEQETTAAWFFWGEIFSDFMMACQTQRIYFSTGRYSQTLRLAAEHVTPSQGLRISSAIWQWIERTISVRYLDTHELSCVDFFLETTSETQQERFSLFKKFFSNTDTGLTCYNLRYAVDEWSNLTNQEQQFICDLLQSSRLDLKWLQATVFVNNTNMPGELELILFGELNFLKRPVAEIVSQCHPYLLHDSLSMSCGIPDYPFSPFGLNGCSELLQEIVLYILRAELSGIEICLEHFLYHAVNTPGREWTGWESIWTNLCANDERRDYLLTRLIVETGNSTVNLTSTRKLWSIIHEAYSRADLRKMFGSIVFNNIGILEKTGHIEDLGKIIPSSVWLDDIFPESPSDDYFMTIMMKIYQLSKLPNINASDAINDLIGSQIELFSKNSIKMRMVSVYTGNILSHIEVPDTIKDRLLDLSGRGGRIEEDYTSREKYLEQFAVKDWVFAEGNQSRA